MKLMKEQLDWLENYAGKLLTYPHDAIMVDAIRSTLLAVGELPSKARKLKDDAENVDHEAWEELVTDFLDDIIRDFGEVGE